MLVPCRRLRQGELGLIKRTAAFENPEFYKKQAMRLSTARTPRVISCAEVQSTWIALPRGCLAVVTDILHAHRIALQVDDRRTSGTEIAAKFQGTLSAIQ